MCVCVCVCVCADILDVGNNREKERKQKIF